MFASLVRLPIVGVIYKICNKIHVFVVDGFLSSVKFRALIKNSGKKSYCHYSVEIKYPENISIGDNTRIGPQSTLGAMESIEIGSNVVVSKGVMIETAGLDFKAAAIPYKHKGRKICIENNVWIGARAIILGGVTIGENSVIGAGVIVSKNIPKNSIVVSQQPRIMDIKK